MFQGSVSVTFPLIFSSLRMERIRGFQARRGGPVVRPLDSENSGDSKNDMGTLTVKKRELYQKKLKMDRKELENKYVELQAKLDDTEAFWKDDSRHKDKRIAELERINKSLADSNSFLNIKLKMLEQELVDKQEEVDQLKATLEKNQRDAAVEYSKKFY